MVDPKPHVTQQNKLPPENDGPLLSNPQFWPAGTENVGDFEIDSGSQAKSSGGELQKLTGTTVRTFEATATVDEITRELEQNSCAIVRNLVSRETMRAFAAELGPFLETTKVGTIIESGLITKRVDGVLDKSEIAIDLIMSPLVLGVTEAVLGPHCAHFQLSSTQAIEILPGETAVPLHRDDDMYPLRRPGPQCQIGGIWAVDDFTLANGATRVIPGSHLWDDRSQPSEEQAMSIEMPSGSVLLLMGSTYHSGGCNQSDASRTAFVVNFNLGWLRQEENQYLTVRRDKAKQFPEDLQKLMGYRSQGRLLGYYEGMDPDWT